MDQVSGSGPLFDSPKQATSRHRFWWTIPPQPRPELTGTMTASQARVREGDDPLATLGRCHDALREGSFNRHLLTTVRQHRDAWLTAKEVDLLQGAVVTAEVFDYYGKYRQAETALAQYGYPLSELKRRVRRITSSRTPGPTFKRELWVVLAHAQGMYRDEEYKEVRDVLGLCSEALMALDPEQKTFLGTRGRLAYLEGQVHRQLGEYDAGLRRFGESIEFSWRRLRQKTPFSEFVAPDRLAHDATPENERLQQFDHAQRLATWTIARCLAIGIGWIYYVTGGLSDASRCLAVGLTMLRSTTDSVHRAYCELLMGAVARARADDPKMLQNALATMLSAADGLKDHPLFRLRAGYEIAVAHVHAGELAKAALAISAMENSLGSRGPGTGGRSLRWTSQVAILKSRLLRSKRDFGGALAAAQQAHDAAADTQQSTLVTEALIVMAEAEIEEGSSDALDRALLHLSEARLLSRENPKTGAVSALHIARAQAKRGRLEEARDEYRRWEFEFRHRVEHGFVRRLAGDVRTSLWTSDDELVLVGENFKTNSERLREHLLRKVLKMQGLTRQEQADRLGLKDPRDVQRWIERFGLQGQ
jgi:tetratricopeptide (TPR) repeat protein